MIGDWYPLNMAPVPSPAFGIMSVDDFESSPMFVTTSWLVLGLGAA